MGCQVHDPRGDEQAPVILRHWYRYLPSSCIRPLTLSAQSAHFDQPRPSMRAEVKARFDAVLKQLGQTAWTVLLQAA